MSNNSNNPFDVILEELSNTRKELCEIKDLLRVTSENNIPKKYVKGDQALADALDVCLSTARKWRKKGIIPSSQHGRVVLYDLPLVHDALKNYRHGRKN